MTLQELSDAWNELRNATLGRGVTPNVSAPLATRVANTYERWRSWLANATPLTDIAADLTAAGWLDEYRQLVAAAKAEGVIVTALPTTFGENVSSAAAYTGKTLAVVAAAAVLGLLYVLAAGGARR